MILTKKIENMSVKWIAKGRYGEWDAKHAGFRWNPKEKVWWTDQIEKAIKLKMFAAADLAEELESYLNEKHRKAEASIVASRATDADIDIPAPEGLAYMPFQKAGIKYALDRQNTLIGDEMGLGKTIQAIGVINALKAEKVLVICPASLRLNWRQELNKWLTVPGEVGIAIGKVWPFTPITIINYDILRNHQRAIRDIEWDLLIVDEVHYIKNPKTQRTQQVFGYGKSLKPIPAKKRLYLTGTPMVNRPVELYPLLRSISSEWGGWSTFTKRYCNAYHNGFAWDVSGASNLDELQDRLRGQCMVRRLKKDVLTDLPAKRRQVVELPANGASEVVKMEQQVRKELDEKVAKAKLAVEMAKASEDKEDYEAAVSELSLTMQFHFTEMSRIRKEVAIAKVPAVIERISDVLNAGHKVVVFAHHHEVTDRLFRSLPFEQVVKLDGRDEMKDRDHSVRRFQTDDEVKVFIGGIHAAGVGLTLTAASHVIFAELDWVPGKISQAEDRCHRIGQKDSVFVQHLVLEGTIDAQMAHTLVAKQFVLDQALDNETDPAARAERQKLAAEPLTLTVKPKKERSASYEEITFIAAGLTPEDIQYWHRGVQLIAEACDHAAKRDGQGFSKVDAHVGNKLAEQESLTARQGALAMKLCQKYRRQLERFGFEIKK